LVVQQAKALVRKGWGKFKKGVDWAKANSLYIITLLAIGNALGITGPETMAKVKAVVLGSDLAASVEVIDNVG
jgi:hypothetical protein